MKAPLKTLALVIAILGLAWAGATPAAAGPLPYASGIVQSDGTILSGSHFTVMHAGIGQYTVTYDSTIFGSIPAMTVTAFGVNGNKIAIATVYSETRLHMQTVFTILVSRTAGKFTPFDSGFQFTIVAT
jgi:hypothetical protein